jgi:hypothetical protein
MPASAVPRRPPPLAQRRLPAGRPLPRGCHPRQVPARQFPARRDRFLARLAEQHPAHRHRPLLQCDDLLLLRGHRPGQRRVLRRQPRVPRLQQLGARAPENRILGGRPGEIWRCHSAEAAPPGRPVSSTARPRVSRQRNGFTEILPPEQVMEPSGGRIYVGAVPRSTCGPTLPRLPEMEGKTS